MYYHFLTIIQFAPIALTEFVKYSGIRFPLAEKQIQNDSED